MPAKDGNDVVFYHDKKVVEHVLSVESFEYIFVFFNEIEPRGEKFLNITATVQTYGNLTAFESFAVEIGDIAAYKVFFAIKISIKAASAHTCDSDDVAYRDFGELL